MFAVELDPALEKSLDAMAAQTGRSKADYIREAIGELIEDWEDASAVAAALANPGRIWTLDEIINGDDLKADGLEG